MSIVVHSNFVKPYFIEELNQEGLSSEDIANSLGVHHRSIIRSLERRSALIPEFTSVRIKKSGKRSVLLLTSKLVQAFLVRRRGVVAKEYLFFLFEVEREGPSVDELLRTYHELKDKLEKISASEEDRRMCFIVGSAIIGARSAAEDLWHHPEQY